MSFHTSFKYNSMPLSLQFTVDSIVAEMCAELQSEAVSDAARQKPPRLNRFECHDKVDIPSSLFSCFFSFLNR